VTPRAFAVTSRSKSPGTVFVLHVQNVTDAAGNPVGPTNITFQAWVLSRGFALFEAYDTGGGNDDIYVGSGANGATSFVTVASGKHYSNGFDLLFRDQAGFRGDLDAADAWLRKYFDARAPAVQTVQLLLKQARATDMAIEVPDLARSLDGRAAICFRKLEQRGILLEGRVNRD